jgi:hypothetical protein
MACAMLLPSDRTSDPVRWEITNLSHGLCAPTNNPNGTYSSLEECQQFARPGKREIRWNVVNSSGYGPNGQVVGECRPTLDPSGQFSSAMECASSAQAQYQAYPDPSRERGWICVNPVLNECIETQNVNVPFTYKVYPSYSACVNAPENNIDSSVMMNALQPYDRPSTMWYIDASRNKCLPSTLSSAPFDSQKQCHNALRQCGSNGQPTLQFSNEMQATDAHWTEPYLGFWKETGRNVTPLMQTPQIALNPVDRPPVIGTQQVLPGAAGSGYGILG